MKVIEEYISEEQRLKKKNCDNDKKKKTKTQKTPYTTYNRLSAQKWTFSAI